MAELNLASAEPFDGTVTVISTFPPDECGVGRYAEQQCTALALRGSVRRLRARRRGRFYRAQIGIFVDAMVRSTRSDSVVVHWNRYLYIGGRIWARAISWVTFGLLVRMRDTTVVFHDPDFSPARAKGVRRILRDYLEDPLRNWAFLGRRSQLLFHTGWEMAQFERSFRRPTQRAQASKKSALLTHSLTFQVHARGDQISARKKLGIPEDRALFLCIGFLVEHKGFERAIEAFGCAKLSGSLYVVGARGPQPDEWGYVSSLRQLSAGTPNVHLLEQFVDDETFDTWILASDAVVCPYSAASSSGVIARARLLDRTVIASSVGGLRDQLGQHDILIGALQHAELIRAFEEMEHRRLVRPNES